MIFSHAFAGAALTKLFDNKSIESFTPKQINVMYFVGIFAAILPDLDLIFLFLDKTVNHRIQLSHSVTPYVLISLLIFLLSLAKNSEFLQKIAVVFLVGAFSHLLLDLIAGGVALWAPLSNELIGIPLNFPSEPTMWAKTYLTSWYMLVEVTLFFSYLVVMSNKKNIVLTALPLFFLIIAISAFTYISFFYL